MPINYLNLYVFAIFGAFAASVAGIVICYTGISDTSYLAYRGMELTTYYLDKNRHDLYFNGLVYSITFGFAFLLLLAVIMIPSPDQLQKRLAATSFAGASGAPGLPVAQETTVAETDSAEDEAPIEIELEPDIESFEMEEEESALSGGVEEDDSDVVYGSGRITDQSHRAFILSSPDSAVKFLLRKELDGRPLKSSQDEIYEGWQKRGLSRGKLRKHFLKIMEWDSVPELEVNEIFNQVKAKAFEINHA
ncbi:MAG: hypothetical protein H8E38_11540 [SAR324 cluster bacterium]|nr:hypothetical protein [SAR324 cluster bacterium]MBL7034459.1 hypothetical protein [SAR324 cluster bacterium]